MSELHFYILQLWEKQALVDSTHLNNSDKLSRIIYGAEKIQIIIY